MADGESARSDKAFFVTVMVLLVVVLVTLAALWMMERRARVRAQQDAAALQLQNDRVKGMFQQMMLQQAMERGVKVARDDLPTQKVQWNGQARDVLLLSASTGERLGFEPGDAVLISQPPASAPTTASGAASSTTSSTTP